MTAQYSSEESSCLAVLPSFRSTKVDVESRVDGGAELGVVRYLNGS
jgi:hypothetical protein